MIKIKNLFIHFDLQTNSFVGFALEVSSLLNGVGSLLLERRWLRNACALLTDNFHCALMLRS